jgi:hypothetical protein
MWNFDIRSVPTELYKSRELSLHIGLEVMCVVLLAVNTLLELIGMYTFAWHIHIQC